MIVTNQDVNPTLMSRQLVKQRLRLLQARRVESLGEPAIDWDRQPVNLIAFALLLAFGSAQTWHADALPHKRGARPGIHAHGEASSWSTSGVSVAPAALVGTEFVHERLQSILVHV
jgi:hypothetical protein